MEKFELVLKNEKEAQYQLLTKLAVVLNLLVLIIIAIKAGSGSMRMQVITGMGLLAVVGLAQYYLQKRSMPRLLGTAIFFILITYSVLQFWWPAILMLVVGFFYLLTRRQLLVEVNNAEIIYPSFPKRKIAWTELNNIILKDGLLTLDFRNNRVAQAYVINDIHDYDLDEIIFNDFCRRQLSQRKNG